MERFYKLGVIGAGFMSSAIVGGIISSGFLPANSIIVSDINEDALEKMAHKGVKVTKNNFEELKKGEKTLLLDFYADWCGPCRMVSPIVDEIADERSDIAVGKINVDEEPELAEAFGVMTIPTLVVMKNGEVVSQSSGARPKAQILSMLG